MATGFQQPKTEKGLMKLSQVQSSPPPARPPEAPAPEVLAYEQTQDQVVLYGEDGQRLSGPDVEKSRAGFLKNLLLPSKMPESVSPDYLTSRKWNFLAEAAGSTQSYLGTAAALGAVGIGNGPLTVGLAWMARDAIDGVGKFVGSQFGRQADRDPKGWYTRGEYVHAAGMMMEATLAVAPQAFLALAPTANAVKAFGATVKGAAQAPIEVHQARDNNLGEVRSKNANQSMLASALGAGLGFGLEKLGYSLIGSAATPVLMAAASATKLFATHQYMRALDLDPVTEKRAFTHVRKWLELPKNGPYPKELEGLELGAPLAEWMKSPERFRDLAALYGNRNYLLDVRQDKVSVLLHPNSGSEDQLQAVLQSSLLRLLQASPGYQARQRQDESAARDWLVRTSLAAVDGLVESFARDQDDPLRFNAESRRAHWEQQPGEPLSPLGKSELKRLLG